MPIAGQRSPGTTRRRPQRHPLAAEEWAGCPRSCCLKPLGCSGSGAWRPPGSDDHCQTYAYQPYCLLVCHHVLHLICLQDLGQSHGHFLDHEMWHPQHVQQILVEELNEQPYQHLLVPTRKERNVYNIYKNNLLFNFYNLCIIIILLMRNFKVKYLKKACSILCVEEVFETLKGYTFEV